MGWLGSLKITGNVIIWQSTYDFLFNFNRHYVSILNCLRDTASYLSKVVDFHLPHLSPWLGVTPWKFHKYIWHLRRNKWSRWAARRLLLGARVGSGQYHVQTTSKAAVYLDLFWWQHPESDRLHLNCAKVENKLDELLHISGSRLRHRSSVACGDAESQVG